MSLGHSIRNTASIAPCVSIAVTAIDHTIFNPPLQAQKLEIDRLRIDGLKIDRLNFLNYQSRQFVNQSPITSINQSSIDQSSIPQFSISTSLVVRSSLAAVLPVPATLV